MEEKGIIPNLVPKQEARDVLLRSIQETTTHVAPNGANHAKRTRHQDQASRPEPSSASRHAAHREERTSMFPAEGDPRGSESNGDGDGGTETESEVRGGRESATSERSSHGDAAMARTPLDGEQVSPAQSRSKSHRNATTENGRQPQRAASETKASRRRKSVSFETPASAAAAEGGGADGCGGMADERPRDMAAWKASRTATRMVHTKAWKQSASLVAPAAQDRDASSSMEAAASSEYIYRVCSCLVN